MPATTESVAGPKYGTTVPEVDADRAGPASLGAGSDPKAAGDAGRVASRGLAPRVWAAPPEGALDSSAVELDPPWCCPRVRSGRTATTKTSTAAIDASAGQVARGIRFS